MSAGEQEYRDLVAALPRARRRPLYLSLMFVCVAVGVIALVLGITGHGRSGADPALVVMTFLGFIGAVVCGGMLVMHLQQVRAEAMKIVADYLGIEHVVKPAKDARAGLFVPFAGLKMLRHGHKGVRLWLGGEIDGRRVDLVEHVYIVSTGKSTHAVTHTAIATPVPGSWPQISLSSRNALAGWWASMTGNDFKVENEAFNARWIIKTENPDFALLFLTPEVQQFLADAPSAETWHVGAGSLCWVVKKQLKPRDIPPPFERVLALRGLLAPELEYWGHVSTDA